ncbi:MAG: thioredoxin family protein [Acidobacteriaceae bacterium]|nr:thioredoxin family protein [Acidobacteriaceae bacterium]
MLLACLSAATGAIAQVAQPFVPKHIYSATADSKAEIAAALKRARAGNKRVLLGFGGDWCGDCQMLDIYMHQDKNAALIDKYYVVVHIDIGRMDRNLDIARQYQVPIEKGVPALAVLDAHGNLIYSQQHGEFENMRHLSAEDLTAFLKRWAPRP